VFFIDNDKAKILNRRKDRGTGAYHQRSLAGTDPKPLVKALSLG
jgi:hypothetical protein